MKSTAKQRFSKKAAGVLAFLIFCQAVFPVQALALTSGPTQPELQTFEPVGTTEMVDLFSGDFTYNIPLFEVPGPDGGYPINLFYNSVVDGESEASMVGLGWNIGIGAINRTVRGLPDDFNGEKIKVRRDMKNNWTAGFGVSAALKDLEIFGAEYSKVGGEELLKHSFLDLSLGAKLMYNSYKGWGYSIDPGISANMGNRDPNSNGVSVVSGLGFSFNSLEGPSVNADVSLSNTFKNNKGFTEGSLGLGFTSNSMQGAKRLTLNSSARKLDESRNKSNSAGGAYSSSVSLLSYERPSYSPQVGLPFVGENISVGFKTGVPLWGAYLNLNVSGFYSSQRLKDRNKTKSYPSYGYLHSQSASSKGLMDFNREKDGSIRKKQPNLPIPVPTPDVLSVSGQGIGGVYTPSRSDVGTYYDQAVDSKSVGGSLQIEAGPSVTPHIGAGTNFNVATNSTIHPQVAALGNFEFRGGEYNDPFEPYYYKAAGEMTAETGENFAYMGGDEPVYMPKPGSPASQPFDFGDQLKTKSGVSLSNSTGKRNKRKARNMSIQPITNGELLNGSNDELLPEYKVSYYNAFGGNFNYANPLQLHRNATAANKDKIAGYTTVTSGGARWNYALPVMNNVQKEVSFSVPALLDPINECDPIIAVPEKGQGNCGGHKIDYKVSGTDEFLSITETPAYAHAYLLTSILGADYVDVNGNGPDDADYGYWMKIEYAKTTNDQNPFKWRTPFVGANYMPGLTNKDADDKGSFLYGEREQYYPAKIMTKTHTAVFHYTSRSDAKGAECWLQNTGDIYGADSYALSSIELYANDEYANTQTPIKTVHFIYAGPSEQLCPGVWTNSDNHDSGCTSPNPTNCFFSIPEGGKLTLKQVYFTYGKNDRGVLSPYEFQYNAGNTSAKYNPYEMDRWGTYKPRGAEKCLNIHQPYVDQKDPNLDKYVSTWHLTKITLPSGAEIEIKLGRDHYAYVQDRRATQMIKITGFGQNGSNVISKDEDIGDEKRKIFFELLDPISTSNPIADQELARYFDDLYEYKNDNGQIIKQLYFKISSDIGNNNLLEDVPGYAEFIEGDVDFDPTSVVNGSYTRAWIKLKQFPIEIKGKRYHPMLVHCWQFLRNNCPDLLFGGDMGTVPDTKKEKAKKVFKLKDKFTDFLGIFRSFYLTCRDKDYGQKINMDRSFIRLNNPNGKKYGDGVRVDKITLHDNWTEEDTPTYGTVYEYETEEMEYNSQLNRMVPTGRMISSGVATNEPSIGSDETALKYAKQYKEDFRLKADNWATFEYPINESYYPGASVGYSKVTVKSLATDYALKRANGEPTPDDYGITPLPNGFATSGATIHEFYTYKDFPIITRETKNDDDVNDLKFIYIPLIGFIRNDHYYGSQGYTVELNDMHGRPMKVTNYGQDKQGKLIPTPLSWVQYDYQFKEDVYTEGNNIKQRKILDNNVTVITADKDPTLDAVVEETAEIGVDREMFVDARESNAFSTTIGINANVDVLFFALFSVPIPAFWPNLESDYTDVKTVVTNKVIKRSGVLKKVEAKDGQSIVITENLKYDPYSGQAILTRVNNNYDEPLYNYSIPAHFAYDRMGPAYQNWGLNIKAEPGHGSEPCLGESYIVEDADDNGAVELLQEGDEFIVNEVEEGENTGVNPYNYPPSLVTTDVAHPETTAILMKKEKQGSTNTLWFDIEGPLSSPSTYKVFRLVRSGKRNLLSASAGSVAALEDPTQERTAKNGIAQLNGHSASVNYSSVDNALSASAVVFSDVWSKDREENCYNEIKNPFRTGERGIWRPNKSYTYVSSRTPLEASGESLPIAINTATDGEFDELPLFNWRDPFFTYLPNEVSKWRLTNEITKYARNGQEAENKNIIGQYSAALYGYNDNVVIAVGANTRNYEMGFEGFEEYECVDFTNLTPDESGNIDLRNCEFMNSSKTTYEIYNIIGGFQNGDTEILIDKPFEGNPPITANATLILTDQAGNTTSVPITISTQTPVTPSGIAAAVSNAIYFVDQTKVNIEMTGQCPPFGNGIYAGKIIIANCNSYVCDDPIVDGSGTYNLQGLPAPPYSVQWTVNGQLFTNTAINNTTELVQFLNQVDSTGGWQIKGNLLVGGADVDAYGGLQINGSQMSLVENQLAISCEKAHTGHQSIFASGNDYLFPQNTLNPYVDSTYIVSAWVYCPNLKGHTYNTGEVGIGIGKENGQPSTILYPSGPIIEGWQKIEGTIKFDGGQNPTLPSDFWALTFKTGGQEVYFDDLRIYPKYGNMQSYVYDKANYRITEILDNNNYFTRYLYDSQGNLISTQKETVDGIKTIQETGSYIR
ncbi:MAG: hypothetical protein GC192_20950 [Bacteroidetes bacterium]|nr:hypothetical protein [Bacteroidota bacterium]